MQQFSFFPQEQPLTLRELPATEQPTSRAQQKGVQQLSTMELLALAIGGSDGLDIAARLLTRFGNLHKLVRTTPTSLETVAGVGPSTAMRLASILEMSRRLTGPVWEDRPRITSPGDGAALLMAEMQYLEQEEMWLILLNTRNQVLGIPVIYRGNLNSAVVRIAEIFRPAIEANAAAIILAHNHPSGDPTPSPEDVRTTQEIVKAGKLLSIELLDHLIIGKQRFVSLKERGLGFG